MKWIVLIFTLGLLYVGYLFYDGVSDMVYYLWDKLKDFAFMLGMTILLKQYHESKIWLRIFQVSTAFLGCRIGVEFLVLAFPALDTPALFNWLFFGSWAVVLYIIFYRIITPALYKAGVYCSVFFMYLKHRL